MKEKKGKKKRISQQKTQRSRGKKKSYKCKCDSINYIYTWLASLGSEYLIMIGADRALLAGDLRFAYTQTRHLFAVLAYRTK